MDEKKVKRTSRVNRGLLLMGWVCSDCFNDELRVQETVRNWSKKQHKDFQLACRWVAQINGVPESSDEQCPAPAAPEPEKSTGKTFMDLLDTYAPSAE